MPAARMAIAAIVHMPRPFVRVGDIFRRLAQRLGESYRPEKHYMRGPGPKCRAKAARPQG